MMKVFSMVSVLPRRVAVLRRGTHFHSPAPLPSLGYDYVTHSLSQVKELFVDPAILASGGPQKRRVETVFLCGKSQFDAFRKTHLLTHKHALQNMADLGTPLDTYPGEKLLRVPLLLLIHGSEPGSTSPPYSKVLFYEDSKDQESCFKPAFEIMKPNNYYEFKDAVSMGTDALSAEVGGKLCFSYALHCYRFDIFKQKKGDGNDKHQDSNSSVERAAIVWPRHTAKHACIGLSRSYYLMQSLVDSPALSVGPEELGNAAAQLALSFNKTSKQGTGHVDLTIHVGAEDLLGSALKPGFPQVAAVGMGSSITRAPRVVDFNWTPVSVSAAAVAALPEIVVVGKGVTFDTGGLNIKGGNGMLTMKKDMAGAAQALALASLIMHNNLPCKLRVLIPIAENSISGSAIRPGDIIRARNGKTTEITNTDAEGRLILADCLVAACESKSATVGSGTGAGLATSNTSGKRRLIIDFATLTGAARVALGNDLSAVFSNDHQELMKVFEMSHKHALDDFAGQDPLWPMPLWEPLRKNMHSKIADLVNSSATPGGGAITAALYLSEFISPLVTTSPATTGANASASTGERAPKRGAAASAFPPLWFHIDFYALNKKGAAMPQGVRAMYAYIQKHIK